MELKLLRVLLICPAALFPASGVFCQPAPDTAGKQAVYPPLVWDAPVAPDSLREIRMTMAASDYARLQSARGEKFEIEVSRILINGKALQGRRVQIRGQSTLFFRRKSLAVTLEDGSVVAIGDTVVKMKKFYLNSLSMDRSYYHNAFAFACLRELNLFPLRYGFTGLFINDQPEGLYLLMERPEDCALDRLGASFLMRRGYQERIDQTETAKRVNPEEEKKIRAALSRDPEAVQRAEGEGAAPVAGGAPRPGCLPGMAGLQFLGPQWRLHR